MAQDKTTEILGLLGDPGKYSWIVFVILCFNYFPLTWNHMLMAVVGASPPHRCKIPEGFLLNESVPYVRGKPDSCTAYANFTPSNITQACPSGWEYQLLESEETIVSEWDLVCSLKYLTNLSTSIYFAGVMLGGVIFGAISDKFGRRPVIMLTLYCSALFGVMVYFVQTFILFCMLRFCIGVLMQGFQTATYTAGMELFASGKHRSYLAAIIECFWATGLMSLAGIAYWMKNWRLIQLVIVIPVALWLIYILILPETLRWLVEHNEKRGALRYIKRAARINGVTVPEELDVTGKTDEELETTTITLLDLFRTPKLRKRSLVLFYVWMATSFGYYGLSLNASRLAGDKYLNFFINGAIEFPAYLSGVWILSRFGRKKPLVFYFFSGGVACIAAALVPRQTADGTDIAWLATTLAWVGKFCITGCWSVIFLYAAEIYPTNMRGMGIGACAFWARVGSVAAPQINTLGIYFQKWLPTVIFGCVAIVAALVSLMLPETLNKRLPDTVEDVENPPKENGKQEKHAFDNIAMENDISNGSVHQ